MNSEPLNKVLYNGSATIHREAERRPFMIRFFKAELPKDAYVTWLTRLFLVYDALEQADDALAGDPVVGRMHSPELHRAAAIDADLRFLAGPAWKESAATSPATDRYVDAIRRTVKEDPPAFVPHQWLRYLGNVLAQRINLRILERAYGLTDEGTRWFRYDGIDDPRAYLGEYHARMNAMALDDAARQRIVEEANLAWKLQIDLTDELAAEFAIPGLSEEEIEKFLADLAAGHP